METESQYESVEKNAMRSSKPKSPKSVTTKNHGMEAARPLRPVDVHKPSPVPLPVEEPIQRVPQPIIVQLSPAVSKPLFAEKQKRQRISKCRKTLALPNSETLTQYQSTKPYTSVSKNSVSTGSEYVGIETIMPDDKSNSFEDIANATRNTVELCHSNVCGPIIVNTPKMRCCLCRSEMDRCWKLEKIKEAQKTVIMEIFEKSVLDGVDAGREEGRFSSSSSLLRGASVSDNNYLCTDCTTGLDKIHKIDQELTMVIEILNEKRKDEMKNLMNRADGKVSVVLQLEDTSKKVSNSEITDKSEITENLSLKSEFTETETLKFEIAKTLGWNCELYGADEGVSGDGNESESLDFGGNEVVGESEGEERVGSGHLQVSGKGVAQTRGSKAKIVETKKRKREPSQVDGAEPACDVTKPEVNDSESISGLLSESKQKQYPSTFRKILPKGQPGPKPKYGRKCRQCNIRFISWSELQKHESQHPELRFECESCSKTFSDNGSLWKHRLKMHPVSYLACRNCSHVSDTQEEFDDHKATHRKLYQCDQCEFQTVVSATFRRHCMEHTGEKPYKCSHCDKSFKCNSHRKRHERLHTGEKPYECDMCGMKIRDPSHFKSHKATHKTDCDYVCEYCARSFKLSRYLIRHLKVHRKEKMRQSGKSV